MSYQHLTTHQLTSHHAITALAILALLPGCGSFSKYQDGAPSKTMDWEKIPDAVPRSEPLSNSGNPESYVVFGQRYFVDFDAKEFSQKGVASWYGTKFHGRKTSSGEKYDMYKMTAAHKTLPLPSYVKVTNLRNDKQIIVKVNDRGPFVDGRIIDLSYAAAQKLDIISNGTAEVEIETITSNSMARVPNNVPPNGQLTITTVNTASRNSAASSSTAYYVQLGAFSQRIHAEQLLQQLTSKAITPVSITSAKESSSNMYRVRVGPFTDKQQMLTMDARLSELGYDQSFIIVE